MDGYLGDFAWSDANADTQWGRFRCQICSLHTFWREPLVEPHEQHRIRHWYRRVAARAKDDALESTKSNFAKERDKRDKEVRGLRASLERVTLEAKETER